MVVRHVVSASGLHAPIGGDHLNHGARQGGIGQPGRGTGRGCGLLRLPLGQLMHRQASECLRLPLGTARQRKIGAATAADLGLSKARAARRATFQGHQGASQFSR